MYLTNLATIARRAGLTVVEQGGWKSRGHGGMTDVRAVICHHTAGGAGNAASLDVVQKGRPDLAGPLSHFLLAKDGTVYVVAAGLCYHAGATLASWQSNAHTIGIEAERSVADINARVPWPERQLVAYAKLCRALQDAFGGVPVLGHKEVCSPPGRKIDPDFDMAAFRGRVASADQEEDMAFTSADAGVLFWGTPFDGTDNFAQYLKGHVAKLEAGQAAVLAAVQAATKDPGITLDAMREIVNDAVEQHVQITGTIEITPKDGA